MWYFAYACGLAVIVADPPRKPVFTLPERVVWDVVRPPDGDFAFSMPTKPARETRTARGTAGPLEILSYSCTSEGADYRLQRVRSPQEILPVRVIAELGRLRSRYLKENARLVKETPIVVDGVIGEDLTYTGHQEQQGGVVTGRTRHFITGHFYYALTVDSPPGKPLPDAAARFLSSLTFEALVKSHHARMKAAPESRARPPGRTSRPPDRPEPADRGPVARIKLADSTPEDALKTFVLAVAARDGPTLRSVTLPDDGVSRLLDRNPASPEALDQMKSRLDRIPMRRLKAGDTARMADGLSRILQPNDVSARRVVLWPETSTYATALEDIGGHWKVLARPFIAARQATTGPRPGSPPPSRRSRP